MQPPQKHKFKILAFYNIVNALLLYVVFRGASVIHGDGPGGFGEVIIKGFMLWTSLSLFIAGLVSTGLIYKNERYDIKVNVLIGAAATIGLILFCGIMVADACTNSNGYCRNWTIHF